MTSFETIRARLHQNAAQRLPALNGEHRLFLDWMAWELAALYRELHRSDDAIAQHLRQRLTTDFETRPRPAHAVACAHPKQPGVVLRPDKDRFTIHRPGAQALPPIYFAPLRPVQLTTARVRCLAAGREMRLHREADTAPIRLNAVAGQALHPGVLWLGLQWDEAPAHAQPLSFFVDWTGDDPERSQQRYQDFSLTQWRQGDRPLTISQGPELGEAEAPAHLDEEYLFLHELEARILEYYAKRFVTVHDISPEEHTFPDELAVLFPPEALAEQLPAGLVWLQLRFPHGFRPEEVAATELRLNCFPIVNRRLDITQDFTPAGGHDLELRPLSNAGGGRAALADQGERFLAMQRVFSKAQAYRPVAFNHLREAVPGTYALQHGRVEANDYRDLLQRLQELTHLLKHRSDVLRLLPDHQIQQALTTLTEGARSLENALQLTPEATRDMGYYLHVKVLNPRDMVFVRFWVTQGAAAEGVGTPGDWLQVTEDRGALNGVVQLMTAPNV